MEDFTITHVGDTELSLPLPFKFIPAYGKTFMFQDDYGKKSIGKPITFENNFWICAYQTTQEFWERVVIVSGLDSLIRNPSHFKGKIRPVEQVSWDDIQLINEAINHLFQENKLTLKDNWKPLGQFSLPSETQWEYAANADQGLEFTGSQKLNDVGWYKGNNNFQTMPVGLKQPNAWKLYDMSGNVWEWCADEYENDISMIPIIGQFRVLRGGSYSDSAWHCGLRNRYGRHSGNRGHICGFRLVFSRSSIYES